MSYLRTTRTVLIRKMPLGTYLYVPSDFRLESFSPVMEIDQSTEQLLRLCNGSKTRSDILQSLSEESGEPVEEIAGDFDEFVNYLVDEGVVEWVESPEPIDPIYNRDKPSAISVDITSACNLRCPFCSAEAGPARPDDLTLEDIIPFVEQVKKYKPTPFALSGGEPLLKKDMVLYMVENLSPIRDIIVTIFTNGTLITKEYAQELHDAGLQIIRVSVDGHTEELHDRIRGKGAFRKTIRGIEYLKEVGIHVNVISTICRTNYPYYREIKEFISHLGDSCGMSAVIPAGKAVGSGLLLDPEENFNIKIAFTDPEKVETGIHPRNRCNAGETIYVASNGDIFPCLYINSREFKVGNIRENDLSEIYKNEVMEEILRLTVNDIEECKECDIRYLCGGGCRAFAYGEYGSLYSPDPQNCRTNKILAKRALERGEENTQRLLQELLRSTRELDEH